MRSHYMSSDHKLTLFAAILININIMMGAGIFINTVELAKRAGLLGGFMYPLVGLLVLPLIIVIAQLVKLHPAGGFYIFAAQEIHPFAGFLSAWSYFTGKLASAILMIHVAMLLCQQVIPLFSHINTFVLDIVVLLVYMFFNLFNLRTGGHIQFGFLLIKMVPITFVILLGLFFISPTAFASSPIIWSGIPSSLPLVLYAAAGFEATCSLSSKILHAERNGPRAIFISFGIVMALVFLFQFLFYALLGTQLAAQASYLGAFPALLGHLFSLSTSTLHTLTAIFHLAIAASALGGSYGIIYSNSWNLYTLAQHNHVFFKNTITALNKHMIPVACVLIEGALALLYLAITAGSQVPLQQISALASAIAYFLSVAALACAKYNTSTNSSWFIIITGSASCLLLLGACIRGLIITGLFPLVVFGTLLATGSIMFFMNNRNKNLGIQ